MGVRVYAIVRGRARNDDYRWLPQPPAGDLRDIFRGLTSFEERSLVLHSSGTICRLLVTGIGTGAVDEVGTALHAAVQLEADEGSERRGLAEVVRLWLDSQDALLVSSLIEPVQRGGEPDLAALLGQRDKAAPLVHQERRLDDLTSSEGRLRFLRTVDALCTGRAGTAAVLSLVSAPGELAHVPGDVLHVLGQDVEAGAIPDPKGGTPSLPRPGERKWLVLAATALGLVLFLYLQSRRT